MKYEKFDTILKTMEDMGLRYEPDEDLANILARSRGKKFSLPEHIESLVYSMLSNQRPWKPIEANKSAIDDIFHGFDPEYLKQADGGVLEEQIRGIKCGNRQIRLQMAGIGDNVRMFERIAAEYGSADDFVVSDTPGRIAKALSSGEYKMKGLGLPLALEYLKGVGIDCAKPDVHIRRILARLGYAKGPNASVSEALRIIHEIASERGMYDIQVDDILWQFCADGYLEVCASVPKCELCGLNGTCRFVFPNEDAL